MRAIVYYGMMVDDTILISNCEGGKEECCRLSSVEFFTCLSGFMYFKISPAQSASMNATNVIFSDLPLFVISLEPTPSFYIPNQSLHN